MQLSLARIFILGGAFLCGTGPVFAHHHHHHHHHAHTVRTFYVAPIAQHPGSYYTYNNVSYYYPQVQTVGINAPPPQPEPLRYGSFSHVDDIAERIIAIANEFCLDLHYNYAHNPGFRETYREAYAILETAKYIDALEHQYQDRDAIRQRLKGMDELFHHVEEDVRGWSRFHRVQVGQLGIITKMEYMEGLIHHLMQDVGVGHGNPHLIPGGTLEVAPPPGPLTVAPLPN